MATLSEEEKREMLRLAGSDALHRDMEFVSSHRHNPVLVDGEADLDRLIEFLTQFNEFINHATKPFRKIIDKEMKL